MTTLNILQLFRLNGKKAVLIGAGGIGHAAALALAQAGAHVAILDYSLELADRTAQDVCAQGGAAFALRCDVTDESVMEYAFEQAVEKCGGLDVMVNASGIGIPSNSLDVPMREWQRTVDVNLSGVFLAARIAARSMLAKGGAIVNVSSIMGFSGGGFRPGNAAYKATKGGVVNLTRALAFEWAQHNIRVNSVAPSWVRTPLIEDWLEDAGNVAKIKALVPLGRIAEPEEIATAILYLASPAASMVTGHTLVIDGGFLAA